MKRITFWLLSTISCLVLLFGYSTSTSGPLATSASSSVESGTTSSFSASSGSGGSSTSRHGKTSSGTGNGSNGGSGSTGTGTTGASPSKATSVTGAVANTQWGPVEVKLTLNGDKIIKVTVEQYPTGQSQDVQINDYALPILTKETIDAQSASIDMVSGATVTSTGYIQSLQSALDQAGL